MNAYQYPTAQQSFRQPRRAVDIVLRFRSRQEFRAWRRRAWRKGLVPRVIARAAGPGQ